MTRKRFPELLARAVLVFLLLFATYHAKHAHAANAVGPLFYHLGILCITAALLTTRRGQLLPPRDATVADVYQHMRDGERVRMTRMQGCLSLLGFVLLAAGAWAAATSGK